MRRGTPALMRGSFCCKPRSDEQQLSESRRQSRSIMSCCRSPSLGVARARLTALGFTVAPDGVHPFGTANCCVYLSGRHVPRAARHRRCRTGKCDRPAPATCSRRAMPPIAATSAMTASPRWCWRPAMPAPTMPHSSRPGCRPETSWNSRDRSSMRQARSDTASFRLAFAADPRADDLFLFTCQRLNAPKVDRSALQSHANGAARIARIVVSREQAG